MQDLLRCFKISVNLTKSKVRSDQKTFQNLARSYKMFKNFPLGYKKVVELMEWIKL